MTTDLHAVQTESNPDFEMERLEHIVTNLDVITTLATDDEARVAYYLKRIVRTAEGFIEEADVQNLVTGDVALIQREYRTAQKQIAELCALVGGVFAVANLYRTKLHEALQALEGAKPDRMWENVVSTMAEVQGIPEHMALMLAYFLLTDDNTILQNDWTDLDGLIRFRDRLTELLSEVGS